jgi:hypothetical protein
MRTINIAAIVFACAAAGCAHAKPVHSWRDVAGQLRPGHPVAIIDTAGTEVRGKVATVGSDSLTLKADGTLRHFDATNIRQIARDGDPLWNGAVIGAAIGVFVAGFSDNRCVGDPPVCNDRQIPARIGFIAIATGAGLAIDALHRDRRVIYQSSDRVTIRIVPALSPRGRGASLLVMWSLPE